MCIYMFCLIFFTLLIFIYIYNELNKQNETFSNDYDLELGSSNQLVNNNPINIIQRISRANRIFPNKNIAHILLWSKDELKLENIIKHFNNDD